jgi:hypothetical protein
MSASSKYVIVYDEGLSRYSVFNSFTKVYEGEGEYPISSVDVADNGYYAVVSKDVEFSTSVEVYNSDFKIVNRYLKNGYVLGVDISNDNLLVATLSVDKQGNYLTEMLVGTHSQSEVAAQTYVEKHFPLKCGFTDDGFYLLCKEALLFFDSNANLVGEYEFAHRNLSFFSVDSEGAVLVFKERAMNKEYTALTIDALGKEMTNLSLEGSITDVLTVSGNSYILTDEGIYIMHEGGHTFKDYSNSDIESKLVAYSDNKIYICTKTHAPLIQINRG